MTQTTAPLAQIRPTVFQVRGKDRFSDTWVTFLAPFRWQAEEWAAQRAFVLRGHDDKPLVTEVAPEGNVRIEWMTAEGWQPYSASEPADVRLLAKILWVRRERERGSRQAFRVVLEDQPRTVVCV